MAENKKPYWLVTDTVGYASGASTITVGEIPAKTLVIGSELVVSTLWAGTSPTLDLGDEDTAANFVVNTEVTATTVGSYMGTTNAFEGAWYPAAKRISITIGGTSLTAGVAFGVLQCLDLSEYV